MQTPWGQSQEVIKEKPGITRVSTASHGGYHLDRVRMGAFRRRFPDFSSYAGGPWFEEDQDWAAVVLAFPDEFADEQVRDAVRTARLSAKPFDFGAPDGPQHYPQWEAIAAWLESDQIGCNVAYRAEKFERTLSGMYERGSMGTGNTFGQWWVSMVPVGGGESIKCTMTLDEIYSKRFWAAEEVMARRTVAAA